MASALQLTREQLKVLEALRRAQFVEECRPEKDYCADTEDFEEEAAYCADYAIFKIIDILSATGMSIGQEKTDVHITDDLYYADVVLDVHLGSPLNRGPKVAQLRIETRANCINGTIVAVARIRDVELIKTELPSKTEQQSPAESS